MKSIKKRHITTKTIWQIFLLVIEITIVVSVLICISNRLFPVTEKFEYIERAFMFYTFYQIITFTILSSLNDIDKDSYLALKTNYKMAELYCETEDEGVLSNLKTNINYQLNNQTFNNLRIRREYEVLNECIEKKNITQIKAKVIMVEHFTEFAVLNWRYSFLLRVFK